MENEVRTYSTLQEEIISVKDFLDGKSLVSEDKLAWNCRVDPKADTHISVPKSLIKSFVEHAFLNDILQHPDGGEIDISIHRTTLGILIMITDNSPLRYQEYSRDRLIGNRLELLDQDIHIYNEKEESSVNYQLLDLAYSDQGKTGTRVLITIVL